MSHSRCVSVIIAAHNARTTIGKAIISALDQNEVSEVIVVDDASTDETADAATEAGGGESRLKILRSEINIGSRCSPQSGHSTRDRPLHSGPRRR